MISLFNNLPIFDWHNWFAYYPVKTIGGNWV